MLFYPHREKIARCEGYPIQNTLKKRFRLCQICKNRYGEADFNKGLMFYGETGVFRELPRPEEIGDYTPYLEFLETKKDDEKKDEEKEQTNKFYL